MTALDMLATRLPQPSSAWGQWVARAAWRLAEWRDARQTRRALSRLSAHELDDIGLTRADLDNLGRFRR